MSTGLSGGRIRASATRLPDEIAAQLAEDILDGRLPPGHALNLSEMTTAMAVSRTPLREAIGQLAVMGLVEVEPSRWTRVADITPESAADAAELAGHLGAAIAHAAVPRLDEEASTAPARALRSMSRHAQDSRRLLQATDAFIGALAVASERQHFTRLWANSRLMIRFQLGGAMPDDRLAEAPGNITRLSRALSTGEAEGVAAGVRALFVAPRVLTPPSGPEPSPKA